jgi:hypothetical protein
VAPGGSATYTISVNPLGSFGSSAVSLSMGAIAGATASVSPSAQSGATLTVSTFSSTSLGTIPILITGISGATTHYAVANLKVAHAAPAAITTPPPGQFIPGGATQFTWNSGNGASQYTLTAGSTPGGANYYSGSASSAQSASVSLPATLGQTVYVTLSSSTPAGVASAPQTYAYTISTQGISPTLEMVSGPVANVNDNAGEVAYTYTFQGGDARALTECGPVEDVVSMRLIQQTASTLTIGFTAKPGQTYRAFSFSCQCPGSGSGGASHTPVISSVSPSSIQPNITASIYIAGRNFGDPSDGTTDTVQICAVSGGCPYSADVTPASDNLIVADVNLPPGAYWVTVISDEEDGESNLGSLGVSAAATPIYDTPPNISGVTPGDIPALSGQAVAITGTNFGDSGTLTICQGASCQCPSVNCLPYTISAWNDNGAGSEVDVVVDASAATPATSYTVTLSTTTDYLGNSYLAAPGAPADSTSASLEIDPAPAPTLTVTANGAQIQPGSCAYISAAPQMPQILATVSNNGTTPPPGDTVAWQLVTTFPRATSSNTAVIDTNSVGASYITNTSPGPQFGTNGPSQSAPPPQGTLATTVSQPANCAWAPWQAPVPGTSGQPSNCPAGNSGAAQAFFGGYATINWSYNNNAGQPFNFYVCGTNAGNTYTNNGAQPSAEQTYIQQTPPTSSYWFPWYIALHETNASQFCQSVRSAPPPYCSQQFNWGFPVWGSPSGYGMMQIDPPPSQTLLWNWQTDVQQAGTKLGTTSGPAFWNSQVQQFNTYNLGLAAAGLPPVPPPPDQQESACTFTLPMSAGQGVSGSIAGGGATNTYWFADAIQLRNYNGGSFSYGGVTAAPNYISWQANSPSIGYWRIFKPNTVNSDIVADVCACIPGSMSASQPNSTCGHNASVPGPWLTAPTSITPSTQTPGAWTVQFTLSGLSGYVTLTSSNPSIFPLPASQIGVISVPTFAFDVVPGAVQTPTLIQVTASSFGTTATASVVLQPQQ